jgi:hypothetical protein
LGHEATIEKSEVAFDGAFGARIRELSHLYVRARADYMQIAFIAWAQRRDARRWEREMREAFQNPAREPSIYAAGRDEMAEDLISREWTITHSFFAASGGFAFDTSELSENQKFLPGTRDRVTLTPEGLLYVAKQAPWLIPNVSAESINDKSKANGLAKAVVCFQATWFMAEIIARLSRSLPISLLELNTFAHALCAILIYVLWWYKPLDVEEPVLIQGKDMWHICADLCAASRISGAETVPSETQREALRTLDFTVEEKRWPVLSRIKNIPKNFDILRAVDMLDPQTKVEDILFFVAFGVAGLAYGGIHLIAWNYPFPSAVQQLLWKVSGITIATSGVAFGFLVAYVALLTFFGCFEGEDTLLQDVCGWSSVVIMLLFGVMYLFARAYLVIACFLTFPYLPPEVFKQPEWSYYFPHIS